VTLRKRLTRLTGDILLHAVLILAAAYMVLPFLWMLSTSLKPQDQIFAHPPVLISPDSNLDAYRELFEKRNILRIVGNTLVIATSATALQLFFCSLAGYGFAKFKFRGREQMFALLLATMIIPFSIILIPLYVIMLRLQWIDTFWPLIIPGAANAFGIFFMRQYISTVSDELTDAARIDGASEFGIYWRIILPIIAPGLVSLGLIFFMASWNNFLFPLVVLKSPENFTLPIAIRSMVAGVIGRPVYHLQMAASVISIVPLVIIFLVFQRRFTEGITAGAMAGQ
jgi:ABC-type glycerol-3-phosphate transport system permease component